MRCKFIIVFIFAILAVNLISASFIYSDKGTSINDKYGIADTLKARINISFHNESLDSLFTDSLGNYISLGEVLILSKGYDYEFNDTTAKFIISNFHILNLEEISFFLPSTPGNITYYLNFSGQKVFNKKFEITSIDNTLKEEISRQNKNLNNSKNKIKNYTLFAQEVLDEELNLSESENILKSIEAVYKITYDYNEYQEIITNLSLLNIPEDIDIISETKSVNYYPQRENVNLGMLSLINDEEYDENENTGYVDALYFWNQENLKTNVSFNRVLITYNQDESESLSIFEFQFDKINMNDEAYFIIENIEGLKFKEDYSQVEESGYYYININNISDKLIFSTKEDVDFRSVPVFISPALSNLNPITVGEIEPWKDNTKSKWILFVVIILILLLITGIIYFIIQSWYQRKYEIALFKNRNNLYNIMIFIQTSKKKGMSDEEIKKILKKSNWTGEQINYALRKYEGKKIRGIIDTPLKKDSQ